MAYDRYDTQGAPRDERSRWAEGRSPDRNWRGDRGRRDERGFFERAGDEVASWFGDEEAERRRRQDEMMREREHERERFYGRERGSGRGHEEEHRGPDRGRFEEDRGPFSASSYRGYSGETGYRTPMWSTEPPVAERQRERGYERGYRPMTGDYGRSEEFFAASGVGRGERGFGDYGRHYERSESRPRDERTRFGGDRESDPHYHSWRERHMNELDRDYDEYRRENQARFERDFGTWRERRQHKRGLLGRIREHMDVVGSDDEHVGRIDRVAGDRIILTKSDPESGGVHHSLSCSEIDRVEGDRVILDLKAEDAKQRWRDESRERALFEREDQGEMGPRMLDRSFEGTYR